MTQKGTEEQPGARMDEQHDGDDASAHMIVKDVEPGFRKADEQPSADARQQHDEDDTEGHTKHL